MLLRTLLPAALMAAMALPAMAQLEIPDIQRSTLTSPATEAPGTPAPLTPSQAFIDAPAHIFPSIDRSTRLDMLDYFNSGSDKPSKNAFKGNARVLALSPAAITFSTSDVQTVDLALVPARTDTLIMVITTLKTPVEDSTVEFYTRSWQPAGEGLFIVPQLSDWMTPEGEKRRDDIENLYPITLARCVYDPGSRTLTLENKLGDFLPENQAAWAKGLLRGKLVYQWNGKKMVRRQ